MLHAALTVVACSNFSIQWISVTPLLHKRLTLRPLVACPHTTRFRLEAPLFRNSTTPRADFLLLDLRPLSIGIGEWSPTHPCHTTGHAGPHPAVRRVELTRSRELRKSKRGDCWPVLCQMSGHCSTVIPSMPGLPLLAFTRRNACLQFSRSQTASIHCSVAGLSAVRFANLDSVPPSEVIGAAPLLSSGKARRYWFFCRLSVIELRCVLIALFTPLW